MSLQQGHMNNTYRRQLREAELLSLESKERENKAKLNENNKRLQTLNFVLTKLIAEEIGANQSVRELVKQYYINNQTKGPKQLNVHKKYVKFMNMSTTTKPSIKKGLEIVANRPVSLANNRQLILKNAHGDNNCLFNAVAMGILGIQDALSNAVANQSTSLRSRVVELMKQKYDERNRNFRPTMNANLINQDITMATYLDRMSKDGCWGGQPELIILGEIVRDNGFRGIAVVNQAQTQYINNREYSEKTLMSHEDTTYFPSDKIKNKNNSRPLMFLYHHRGSHYKIFFPK